jgi:signal transduction histidine kinase
VKDEGPGLTEEDKQKLFLKNQQLSAKATDGEPSTGLGLSIVKKYTELMNGKVWAESTLGNGAKFCIELPKSNA